MISEEEKLEAARKLVAEADAAIAEQKKLDQEQLDKAKEDPKKDPIEHPDDKIARAEAAAERIEAANKILAQQLEEARTLAVNKTLGGESEISDKPTEAEKAKAGAKALVPDGMECPGVTD